MGKLEDMGVEKMISTQAMVRTCHGLVGTKDVNGWETTFLVHVHDLVLVEKKSLSDKQLEVLERIYNKHFAGG